MNKKLESYINATFNVALAKEEGIKTAVLWDLLLRLSQEHPDEKKEWFDYPEKWIEDRTALSKREQNIVIKKLENDGCIKTKKGYFKIL